MSRCVSAFGFPLSALATLALAASLRAETSALIVAPERAAAGDLVILDASGSQGESFVWILGNADKTALPVDDGRRCVFASGTPGTYRFFLVVAGRAEDGGLATAVARHEVTIGEIAPPPPPPPPPVDLAGRVAAWLGAVAYDAKASHVPQLAAIYRAVAAEIDAGTLAAPRDAILATAARTDALLGPDGRHWTGFREALRTELNARAAAGRLATMADHARTWREIAQGLGG